MGSLGISDSWHHKDVPGPAAVTADPRDPTPGPAVKPVPGRHILAAFPDCSLVKVRLESRADIRDTGRARVTSEGQILRSPQPLSRVGDDVFDRISDRGGRRTPPVRCKGHDTRRNLRRSEGSQATNGLPQGRPGREDVIDEQNPGSPQRSPAPGPSTSEGSASPVGCRTAAAGRRAEMCKHLWIRNLQPPSDLPPQFRSMIDAPMPDPPRSPGNRDHQRCCDVDSPFTGNHLREIPTEAFGQLRTPPVLEFENSPSEIPGELAQAEHFVGDPRAASTGDARRGCLASPDRATAATAPRCRPFRVRKGIRRTAARTDVRAGVRVGMPAGVFASEPVPFEGLPTGQGETRHDCPPSEPRHPSSVAAVPAPNPLLNRSRIGHRLHPRGSRVRSTR